MTAQGEDKNPMGRRGRLGNPFADGQLGWLLRSGAGLGGMRIFNLGAGLATTVLLARVLGAEEYGLYAFALGWVFILGMPMQMGLPTLVMRQVAIYRSDDDSARLKGIVRWAFLLIGLSALLIGLVCGVVAGFFALSDQWPAGASPLLLGAAFVLLCLLGLIAVYRSIVGGFENVVAGSLPDTFVRPALFLVGIAALSPFLALDPGLVMALHALAALVAVGLGWSMASRRMREIAQAQPSQAAVFETRAWLASLWPMTLIAGAAMINSRLDIAMLGTLTGPASVAVYDIGAKVGGLLMITQALLNASIAPRIARLYAGGNLREVQSLMVQACRLSFIPSAILLAGIWLGGPYVFPILFGPEFEESHLVAVIVAIGFLFSTGVGAVGTLLNMSGHERITAAMISISAASNAVLNAILIPIYGAYGAAVSTTLTVLIVQSLLWWKAMRLTGIRADVLAIGRSPTALSTPAERPG